MKEFVLFILSVTIATLLLLFLGGLLRSAKRGKRPTFRRKLFFFPVFVLGIFLAGWFAESLQQWVLAYLQANAFVSTTSIIVTLIGTWFLYDWAFWTRR